MPTSTATLTTTTTTTTRMAKSPVSLKATTSSKGIIAILRSLYPRAARAFLQRNVELTHSLLLSAFSNLDPPYSSSTDPLSSHRRKWDMLRITLETTLYSSMPQTKELPDALRSILALSPPSLLATMHTRSLKLFTPVNRGKPSSEFLPSQILVALVLASVKLDCVQVGREMVEDWLSCRNQPQQYSSRFDGNSDAAEGYEKVLEMYCLHVLPRLEDWDYAKEFLHYETELPEDKKSYLVQSLKILHTQHLEDLERISERQRQSLLTPSPSSSRTATPRPPVAGRPPSPSHSSTSASSNSTHTVVPHTTRSTHVPSSLTSLTPTVRASTPQLYPSSAVAVTRHTSSPAPLPRPPPAPQVPVTSVTSPSLLTILKSSIIPRLTTSNMTFIILMFLVPILSFIFRLRRRRMRLGPNTGSTLSVAKSRGNAADEARKRLKAGWWAEIRKAFGDTAKMATGGIV